MNSIVFNCQLLVVQNLHDSWPWYAGGVLIGLMVPALLIAGNKLLGVSSALRHICAACFPAHIPFLQYEWRKQIWSILFAAGILLGGFIGGYLFRDPKPEPIAQHTVQVLERSGVPLNSGFLPQEIFTWHTLFTWKGLVLLIGGGFLVGFGTRYAGGCTSGHGIAGLSTLQWPSLIAVASFFIGGIISSVFFLPFLLKHLP
jgi:uncharacterized protein